MVLLFIIFIEGAVVTVFNSFLTRNLDKQDLQRTFSSLSFGYLLGELIFRSIGAWIAEEAGMSLVFYLAAIVFAISIIPIALIRIQTIPKEPVRVDYRPLLQSKRFIGILAYSFAVVLFMEVGVVLMPNYLSEVVGLELSTIGRMGSLASLGGAILTLTLGRLRGKGGLVAALTSLVVSMLLLLLYPVGAFLVGGMFLIGSFHASTPIIEAFMGRSVSAHLSGLAFGFIEFMLGVALLIGPIIAGLLYEISPHMPMFVSIGGLLVLVAATLTIPRVLRREREEGQLGS
jgi:MFS family permease